LPSDRRVLECLLTGIREAHKHGFWLLLRTEGFKPVGVMTAKKFEMDPSKGVTRLWAVGVGLDGKGVQGAFGQVQTQPPRASSPCCSPRTTTA
jgi:hypothetical protein